jgi:hypothetical protein
MSNKVESSRRHLKMINVGAKRIGAKVLIPTRRLRGFFSADRLERPTS